MSSHLLLLEQWSVRRQVPHTWQAFLKPLQQQQQQQQQHRQLASKQ
jgi:hypothetical protein